MNREDALSLLPFNLSLHYVPATRLALTIPAQGMIEFPKRAEPGVECTCPAKRTLFNIAWSCVSTIIICAWVSVHPNVPPSGQWRGLWRRLEMMFWTIIAPELILAWAVRQWYAAWEIRDAVNGTREGGLLSLIRGFETNYLQRIAHWSFSDDKILVWDCKCVRCAREI